MVEIQERVATVEGRVVEHARMLTDVAGAIRHLEARMDQRFTSVDLRFTGVENRFIGLEGRFTALEGRLTALDQKLDRRTDALDLKIGALGTKLEREVGKLDQKLDSHFRWLVGLQFAMLIALVASFLAG